MDIIALSLARDKFTVCDMPSCYAQPIPLFCLKRFHGSLPDGPEPRGCLSSKPAKELRKVRATLRSGVAAEGKSQGCRRCTDCEGGGGGCWGSREGFGMAGSGEREGAVLRLGGGGGIKTQQTVLNPKYWQIKKIL